MDEPPEVTPAAKVPITLPELIDAVKELALLQMQASIALQSLIRSQDRPTAMKKSTTDAEEMAVDAFERASNVAAKLLRLPDDRG